MNQESRDNPVGGSPVRLAQLVLRWPSWVNLIVACMLSLAIGWLDYFTGWELSLFILYALPISFAVWFAGTNPGLFVAALCGLTWWTANQQSNPYGTLLGFSWATVSRLLYFIMVVMGVAAVRKRQETDAARIRMLEELRQLESDIVGVSDHEQKRIGQDLHDGLCQSLSAIGCAARMLAVDLGSRGMSEADDAALIEASIQRTVEEARDLARGIFPVHADGHGLSAALADLANTTSRLTGIDVAFEESDEIQLDNNEFSMNLFRIAQESLANAIRHSGARRVTVSLSSQENALILSIQDDGRGIERTDFDKNRNMGLRTMQYRARSMGARLDVSPHPLGGTRVLCHLPLTTPDPAIQS